MIRDKELCRTTCSALFCPSQLTFGRVMSPEKYYDQLVARANRPSSSWPHEWSYGGAVRALVGSVASDLLT